MLQHWWIKLQSVPAGQKRMQCPFESKEKSIAPNITWSKLLMGYQVLCGLVLTVHQIEQYWEKKKKKKPTYIHIDRTLHSWIRWGFLKKTSVRRKSSTSSFQPQCTKCVFTPVVLEMERPAFLLLGMSSAQTLFPQCSIKGAKDKPLQRKGLVSFPI